jgi:hypothetical protein
MPRSYPYDHFTVTKQRQPPVPRGEERARGAHAAGEREGPLHYGKRFAETEELSHARQMNHQLEELAGVEAPKISHPREPGAQAKHPKSGARPDLRAAQPEPLDRGPPIGAVPVQSPPPRQEGIFGELLDVGERQIRLLRHSVRDGVAASYRLATLPLQAMRYAVRRMVLRLSPWHQAM